MYDAPICQFFMRITMVLLQFCKFIPTLSTAILSFVIFSFINILTPIPGHSQVLKQEKHFAQLHAAGLPGNSISTILVQGTNIWLGTGKGLSMTSDGGVTFIDFTGYPGIGKGGVSALAEHNGAIWVATAYDTVIEGRNMTAGGGLSRSIDAGITWHHISQPVDPNKEDSLGYKPTTTNILNVTFDIAIDDSAIWITSWGGGLRKSNDNGATWTVVTPDGYSFDVLAHLNHRAFSVITAKNGLWVGTAGGINKSTDGGLTWTNYTAQNGSGISGNFVTALAEQITIDGSIIWAATWKAEGVNEFYGVSRTADNGLTWETMLEGEFAHNFGFNGDEVYVATDDGLYKSPDRGETWGLFPWITDSNTGERVLTTEYFDVKYHGENLWIGTKDGLVKSTDGGISWNIFRSFKMPGSAGEPAAYAYPNPFSPLRHNRIGGDGYVRIQYRTYSNTEVTLDIFDFGMNLVKNVVSNRRRAGGESYAETWDGTNNWGVIVANGVYFYRLKIRDQKTFWGKIIVVN